MARVLIIEDDVELHHLLGISLGRAGHECTFARLGAEGLERARAARPDIVLLDWMLPDQPGIEVCQRLRQAHDTLYIPVVFITARGGEEDRVRGFAAGAADYVVKPLSLRELALRVQAVLHRVELGNRTGSVECGRLRIDRRARKVWVDGREVDLQLYELELLLALYENRDRALSREALLGLVWGHDAARRPLPRTLSSYLMHLREKLGGAGSYLETVRGTGYRFTSPPALPRARR